MVPQQPLVLGRHQLVAQHPAMHRAETRLVGRVHHLLRHEREEMHAGFDRENQGGVAPGGARQGLLQIARRLDRVVGAGRDADAAADARLVHDPHTGPVHRHRLDGTNPCAGETADALLRNDGKEHWPPARPARGVWAD